MRIAVLGPLVLSGTAGDQQVTPRKARHVLTMLAFAHPAPLSLDALIDGLWDDPPPAAAKTVQGLLSRLRGAMACTGSPPATIEGGPSGYRMTGVGELDLIVMQRHADIGNRALVAGAWTVAIDALRRARVLFRERPELPETAVGLAYRARLDELQIGLEQDHVVALMLGGQFGAAAGELELLTRRWPLREHLWALRMSTLAHDGRSAEALRVYGSVRQLLVDELGLEPGHGLRDIERVIIAGHLPALPSQRARRPVRRPAVPSAPTATPPTSFVEIDDIHIAYKTVTTADPAAGHIVLLNPGTLPVDCVLEEPHFARTIGLLTAFAHVTWFDRRGIGLSDRCTADNLPTTTDWMRDLAAVVDEIGADAPVLIASEDTSAVALQFAVAHPERTAGVVLTNAYARFARSDDYPCGLDPFLAETSVADVTDTRPSEVAFDLLAVIAPSMADDADFRKWWDDAGHRGASSRVAHALRARHQDDDIRQLLTHVETPVLHLVNPAALAHDRGHDRFLEAHLADITTVEIEGRDELWWLDTTGTVVDNIERFVERREARPVRVERAARRRSLSGASARRGC